MHGSQRSAAAIDGSQSTVQKAVNAARAGDTIEIRDGSWTWSRPVKISKSLILKAEHLGKVTLIHGGGSDLIDVTTSNRGNTEIAGFLFEPGRANNSCWYVGVSGSGRLCLMHDCSFSVPDWQLAFAVKWYSIGGVVWNCKFWSPTINGTSGSNGTASGCFVHKSDKPWNDASTFGDKDVNGDQNLYIEDCEFENIYNQAVDMDDNSRVVLRYCKMINSQALTHGTSSKSGGRQVELYGNQFKFVAQPKNSRGVTTVNMNRWFWWRAGTGRVFDNSVDSLSSQDWGNKVSWMFIAESLTFAGEGSGCQTEADYQGVHWPGSGGDGKKQVPDPIYFWNNSGPGAQIWGTNDHSEGEKTCNGGASANVIKLGRDIIFARAPGYRPYTYPHPARGGGPQRKKK